MLNSAAGRAAATLNFGMYFYGFCKIVLKNLGYLTCFVTNKQGC